MASEEQADVLSSKIQANLKIKIILFDGYQNNHFLRHQIMMEFITNVMPINYISGKCQTHACTHTCTRTHRLNNYIHLV